MDALQEAISSLAAYQYRINQDTFRGDLEARTRYEDCAYKEGMLSAAIAQAEAAQPRFVRISNRIINLAQITYVDLDGRDADDNRRVEICFPVGTEYGSVFITFGSNHYEPIAKFLREMLQPTLIAEIDLPKRENHSNYVPRSEELADDDPATSDYRHVKDHAQAFMRAERGE